MRPYLDLVRPQNLFIVALTQLAFQYFVIDPSFRNAGIFWKLSPILFSILMGVTVLITAGGYVINDIFDTESDRLNKNSEKQIVGTQISIKAAWAYYFRIVMLGAILSLFVAKSINQISLFLIYPAAVILLFLYSKYFKNLPLIGNLVVSSFIGIVLFILLFAEREGLAILFDRSNSTYFVLKCFSLFIIGLAFLSNWAREIVKDIEDVEGDRTVGSKTLAVLLGVPTTKIILLILEIVICGVLFYWYRIMGDWMSVYHFIYFIVALVIPMILILFFSLSANVKKDFQRLSILLKIYMFLGIAYLVFYPL